MRAELEEMRVSGVPVTIFGNWLRRRRLNCARSQDMTPSKENRRQFVSFSFYRVSPEWRRLPQVERAEHRREFAEVIRRWSEQVGVLGYSLVGLRADCDFLLWRIAYSLDELQEMSAHLLRTHLGGYIQKPYSYLSMTRRSKYMIGSDRGQHSELPAMLKPGGCKYLFVFPMVRTRNWYVLPFEERERMVHELTRAGHEFTKAHANVMYSFGLDDQDFVITVETDEPSEMLERVLRLRESDSSTYVQRDTPNFTCVRATIEEMLEKIG
ncbi:MAG TPA: chlorite dismutase family protein [Clostridia bacterium]|nr:chlorite dismutase family protein [Clostridia bacterium]